MEALLTPTAAVQLAENERISAWLARAPASAAAHEEAAMLVASLGLRESAGRWTDRRQITARVTAHLALATVLRGEGVRTDPGRVAEAWLSMTLHRAAEMDERLEGLKASPSRPVQIWRNALETIGHGDWRQLAGEGHATLLEQEAYVGELAFNVTVAKAMAYLASLPKVPEVPDWVRLCMSNEYRLPAARFLLAHALDSEIAEARTVAGGRKDSQELIAWLNTPPAATIGKDAGGRPAVSAIDPGMWASYSQRHLFYVLRKLGEASERERQPEKREELREATAPFVTQLTLGPTLRTYLVDDPDESLALTGKMARLTREHPEWVTPYIWADLAASWRRLLPGVTPIGDPAKFFSPPIPRGSVQGFRGRGGLPEVKQHPDLLIAASRMDFYDPGLARDSSKALGENTAAFEKRVGRLTEYSLSVLHELVRRTVTEPDVCAGWLEKASALDPADYLRLGRYQGVHGKTDAALAAYQKGLAADPEPAQIAETCFWLVSYYHEHNRMPEANELVLKAAKAGTTMGNVLPGLLCEKIGDLKHAEEWLRRIDPEDSDELVTFYGRHRDDPAHPEYLEKYQEGFAKYFPDGPEPATLVQFAGKPVEGFRFKFYPHPYVINAGIHPAAVIVAVNGQRVRNLDQFNFLGDSTLGSAFQAIIWQDGKYQTVTVPAKPAIGWDFE